MASSSVERLGVVFLCMCCATLTPSICLAEPFTVDSSAVLAAFELPFPDARLEVDYQTRESSLLLAWPFVTQLHSGGCGREHNASYYIDASVEYQLEFRDWASRGVGAFRSGLVFGELFEDMGLGPTAEVGGVAGTDGHGVMAGGGLALAAVCDDYSRLSTGLELNYRHYFLFNETRGEFSLDLRVPFRLDAGSDDVSWWQTFAMINLVVPNVRWELVDDGQNGVTLSLPLMLGIYAEDTLAADVFIEPQYRTKQHEMRGLMGARAMWVPIADMIGPLVEAGGLLGTDGSGGMLGTGLVLAFDYYTGDSITSLAAVYRRTWTSENNRQDVSFDLRYAFGTGP